jgi:flagellar assembly protein FliH
MSLIADFDFQALEPLAPPRTPVSDAAAVMDVLAEARAEADQIRENARNEGYAAGRADAIATLEPALAALTQAIGDVQASQGELAIDLERRAVELGLRLAGKVVGGALSVQPELVVESVTGVLRGIVDRQRVTVLVNPADLDIVREAMDGLRASLGGIDIDHCVVEAERRVGRGGCIVRTPVGDVDASIETKLERAGEVVASALGRS